MGFKDDMEMHLRASTPGIAVETDEPFEVLAVLQELLENRPNWTMFYWDCHRKLQPADSVLVKEPLTTQLDSALHKSSRVVETLNIIPDVAASQAVKPISGERKTKSIFVLNGWHRPELMNDIVNAQALQNLLMEGKKGLTIPGQIEPDGKELRCTFTIVFLGSSLQFPSELRRMVFPVKFSLPAAGELLAVAEGIPDLILPDDDEHRLIIADSARGLTRMEAETAFALCATKRASPDELPARILDIKADLIGRQNWIEIYDRQANFSDLVGVDQLGLVCEKMMAPLQPGDHPDLRGRGALLIGVSGAGKTQSIKCMGGHTNRLVLHVMLDALRSKYVGDSESHFNHVLEQADAMAPCILAIDEAEKMLATSSEDTVSTRMFGRLLQWQQDHTSDVYLMVSVNDIRTILERNPEFVRSERFDFQFFFDLPKAGARRKIWRLYARKYGLEEPLEVMYSQSRGWTGADIKQCCRIAKRLGITLAEAAREIRPLSKQAPETINALRRWAHDKCRAVDRPGIYTFSGMETEEVEETPVKAGRRRHLDN